MNYSNRKTRPSRKSTSLFPSRDHTHVNFIWRRCQLNGKPCLAVRATFVGPCEGTLGYGQTGWMLTTSRTRNTPLVHYLADGSDRLFKLDLRCLQFPFM